MMMLRSTGAKTALKN
jgi:hypothetical protein